MCVFSQYLRDYKYSFGVKVMYFKRGESFRFAFKEPLKAKFSLLIEGKPEDVEKTQYDGEIIDISPNGMKIFSKADFGEHNQLLQFDLHFQLDEVQIHAVGDIIWQRQHIGGKQYGLTFLQQPKLETLIITELKARRRKEVLNKP